MPDHLPENIQRSSWFMKLAESFLFSVAIINLVATFIELSIAAGLIKSVGHFIDTLFNLQFVPAFLFAMVLSIYWHRIAKINAIRSERLHAIFRGILRYWLAFDIATYGFAKILKTQFGHSFQREDMLVGSLDGFNLTWQYFSHSYAFAVIIALLQIGGSIFLLFRRTTILGAIILLPVLVNILLINVFYKIANGAFINSILFTLGLLYLLLLRWHELKKFLFQSLDSLPRLRLGVFQYPLKLLPIASAFLIIWYFTLKYPPASFIGKWKVDLMVRDGDTVKTNAWLTNPNVWTNVYLEKYDQMSICANPYMFDQANSQYGSYHYDSVNKNVQLIFPGTHDTAAVKISNYTGKKMEWRGIIRNDTVAIWLSKLNE